MGGIYSTVPPKVEVDHSTSPIYDPLYGFPSGRKEKVMKVTPEEMESAMLELDERDYCAHKLIDLKLCIRKEFPCNWNCKHFYHAYHQCLYDEEVDTYKEYEREKRLKERQARKELRAQKLAEQAAKQEE